MAKRPLKHYRSEEAFRKSAAFIHIHNIPHEAQSVVVVAGHRQKIKNTDTCHHCGMPKEHGKCTNGLCPEKVFS